MSTFLEDTLVAEINGAHTKTLPTFYRKIAKLLRFPDYFGKNMDALADCLSDLSWLEEKNVILLLDNPADLLSSEDAETRASIFEIFNEAMENQIEEDRRFEVIGERG